MIQYTCSCVERENSARSLEESGGRWLQAPVSRARLVRPGAPANHRRMKTVILSTKCGHVPWSNLGGTAEATAFVPLPGRRSFFHFNFRRDRMKDMMQKLREASIEAVARAESMELGRLILLVP